MQNGCLVRSLQAQDRLELKLALTDRLWFSGGTRVTISTQAEDRPFSAPEELNTLSGYGLFSLPRQFSSASATPSTPGQVPESAVATAAPLTMLMAIRPYELNAQKRC
jgi:hypothetical protein